MGIIPLTYTQSIEQESLLRQIEMARVQLIALVRSPSEDRDTRFTNTITAIASAYSLEQSQSIYKQIERIVTSQKRQTNQYAKYKRYWSALQDIHESWVGTTAYRDSEQYSKVIKSLDPDKKVSNQLWESNKVAIEKGIKYLTGNEHPVVQTAILSALVFTSHAEIAFQKEIPMIVGYAVLASHGYLCNGRVNPLLGWATQHDSLKAALQSIEKSGTLNHWILFVSLALKQTIEESIKALTEKSEVTSSVTPLHIHLTKRQKSILNFLDKPGNSIDNSTVRRLFGISQITASRDLSYLASIGLVSMFGKSRSTSYIRSGQN